MIRKIITILIVVTVMLGMYNYVLAKYVTKQNIQIAEVNVENTPIKKKRYNFEVLYIDKDTNASIRMRIKRITEGERYEVEILEFDGYTYLYSDKDLIGIMEKDTTIRCYYKKNET